MEGGFEFFISYKLE